MIFSKEKTHFVSLFLLIAISEIQCANILFLFGGGNLSHKINIWPLVIGLADAGHNVTFTSSSDKVISVHPNVTDITPKPFLDFTKSLYSDVDRIQARLDGVNWDTTDSAFHEACLGLCRVMLDTYKTDHTFNKWFEKGTFDLMIINGAFNDCIFYLVDQSETKFIIYSSTTVFPWFYGAFGLPIEASVIPDLMANVGFPPGFFGRMNNVYRHHKGYFRDSEFANALKQIYLDKLNPRLPIPSIVEIERNASLVFINSHYSTDFARSLPPMFVNIGGMQCFSEVGPLPKEFKDFMDDAVDGVVLITFGSTIDFAKLDFKYTRIFLEMMRKFDKVRFIWRWDGPMPADTPANVMPSNWLPQRAILDHPKTVAFMTHGGLNSITEATFHGVPLITFPLFADQDFNAYRVQAQGLGVSVEFRTFSQEQIDGALQEVLQNKMYKKNMIARSKIFKDRIRSPTEEAVSWTNFVLRQDDTSALKPMLVDQSFVVRQSVDVYFAFFAILILLNLFVLYILRRLINRVFG